MKIFFTGASSFSGFWFAKTLAEAGHEVTATFTRPSVDDYPEAGFARDRVAMAKDYVRPVWNVRMGDANFFKALEAEQWDAVCLHGAFVANHKASDFPVHKAFKANTQGIPRLVDYLAASNQAPIIWTGTYFEANEGKGSEPLRNFSPYALSKQLSWEYTRFYCEQVGVPVRKFVMPNPFGPWEGKGFTSYLARTWLAGEVPTVQTPKYVRDNIPVTLLSEAYLKFAEQDGEATTKTNPSDYVMAQGEFALYFAQKLSSRWQMDCPVLINEQTVWNEPLERTNLDPARAFGLLWDVDAFWNGLVDWYKTTFRV